MRNRGPAEDWSEPWRGRAEQRQQAAWVSVASEWKLLNSWMFNRLASRCDSFHLLPWDRRSLRGRRTKKMSVTQEAGEWSDHPSFMWRLTVSPGMRFSLCHAPPSRLPLHSDLLVVATPHSEASATGTRGAAPTLTPPRWAATEDHGPAVAAQTPQRLPAPVDLQQSRYLRSSLPPFLLPGCSNAAPARPATPLPPRVGGERAPTTSARRRERGETEGDNWSATGKVWRSENGEDTV